MLKNYLKEEEAADIPGKSRYSWGIDVPGVRCCTKQELSGEHLDQVCSSVHGWFCSSVLAASRMLPTGDICSHLHL